MAPNKIESMRMGKELRKELTSMSEWVHRNVKGLTYACLVNGNVSDYFIRLGQLNTALTYFEDIAQTVELGFHSEDDVTRANNIMEGEDH